MPARPCIHVYPNGEFCGSPALRDRDYCFFHLTHLGRKLRRAKLDTQPGAPVLELPPLENAESIQIGLMEVIDAVVNQRIDNRRAGLIIYALQTATSTLRNGVAFHAGNDRAAMCSSYDSLEQDYDICEHAEALTSADTLAARNQDDTDTADVEENDPNQLLAVYLDETGPGDPELIVEKLPPAATQAGTPAPGETTDNAGTMTEPVDKSAAVAVAPDDADTAAAKARGALLLTQQEITKFQMWNLMRDMARQPMEAPNPRKLRPAARQALLFGLKKPPQAERAERGDAPGVIAEPA